MNVNYKGILQEYCASRHLSLPEYKVLDQWGLPHCPEFQVKVRVNDEWFIGEPSFSKKKQAEQSAAQIAYEQLTSRHQNRTTRQSHSLQTAVHRPIQYLMPTSTRHPMKHMPIEYSDCEEFILDLVRSDGGRIRKIWPSNEHGEYQFEITGTYRYCENVHRNHRKNHVYFTVDPISRIYRQKCHDPKCLGYESSVRAMSANRNRTPIRRRPLSITKEPISGKRLKREIE